MSAETVLAWKRWHERRAETVAAPYGPLALIGTYWLDDVAGDGTIPGLPGRWRQDGGAVVHEADGVSTVLEAEGEPVFLPDGRKLLAIVREGLLAVRVWDPRSPARLAFAGIAAFDPDERWVLPAVFRPFEADRTVRVPNADGRERGLGLGGELAFTVDGTEHTLAVTVEDDGRLWGVIADATSGTSTFRFRFLHAPAPDPDGSLTLDLNRTTLPPCAFADAFICPFPPPGNTLAFALEAGERAVLTN
ncbi:DUF1684 domain-containing protein [Streptomyces sp. NPDC008139]|uniref:DUF1684 domain-containing protein n=1 Tax=Streptomyces sp. NPDC008139 TaxID=3364814 RepID=UPI0036E4AA78